MFDSSARKIIEQIIEILGPHTTVSNITKFNEEFGNNYVDEEEEEEEEEEGDENDNKLKKQKNKKNVKHKPQVKPTDYKKLFYDNIDDDFKMVCDSNHYYF